MQPYLSHGLHEHVLPAEHHAASLGFSENAVYVVCMMPLHRGSLRSKRVMSRCNKYKWFHGDAAQACRHCGSLNEVLGSLTQCFKYFDAVRLRLSVRVLSNCPVIRVHLRLIRLKWCVVHGSQTACQKSRRGGQHTYPCVCRRSEHPPKVRSKELRHCPSTHRRDLLG